MLLAVCLVLFVVLPFIGATLMQLLWTLVIGLLLGAVARLIAPGSGRMGCMTTSLVGVAGSLLGTLAARALETGALGRLLLQIGVAVALVMVLRPSRKRGRAKA